MCLPVNVCERLSGLSGTAAAGPLANASAYGVCLCEFLCGVLMRVLFQQFVCLIILTVETAYGIC